MVPSPSGQGAVLSNTFFQKGAGFSGGSRKSVPTGSNDKAHGNDEQSLLQSGDNGKEIEGRNNQKLKEENQIE